MTDNTDKFVPWKQARNWECQKCSVCCYHYTVPLTDEEVERFKNKDPNLVQQTEDTWYINRKEGEACVFLAKSDGQEYCGIQDNKPISCKMYPFYVSQVDEKTPEDAIFELDGEKFNVLISTFCKGNNRGHKVEDVIPEAIHFWLRKDIDQSYTTSSKECG